VKNFPQLKGFRGNPGLICLIGHRGARGLMPENTIEGFEFTLDLGVTAIEFDVLLSKDNVPVITHDYQLSSSLTRDYNGKWIGENNPRISDLTVAQLKQFDVGGLDSRSIYGENYPEQEFLSEIRIPKLSELLDLACLPKGQNLYLLMEIKSDGSLNVTKIVSQILDEIRERKLSDRTVLHSFDWELLKECHRLAPEIPRSFLSQLPENNDVSSDPSSSDRTPDFSSFKTSIPKAIANQEGQMWCPYFKDVTSELVQEAHSLDLLVCTWTVNEIEDMENMIDAGVDGIITDYPNRAQKVFKTRGLNG
jgi:glycerophosphoryl diester phosphodiesterase